MAIGSIKTSADTTLTGMVEAFKNADSGKTVRLDDGGKNVYTSSKIGGAIMNLLAKIGIGVKARNDERADGLNMVTMAMIKEFGPDVTEQTFKQMEKWHGRSYFELGNGNAVKVADLREMAQIARGIADTDKILDDAQEWIDMDAFSGNIDDLLKGTPLDPKYTESDVDNLISDLSKDLSPSKPEKDVSEEDLVKQMDDVLSEFGLQETKKEEVKQPKVNPTSD